MKKFDLKNNLNLKIIKKKIKIKLKKKFNCNWTSVLKKLEKGYNYNFKDDLNFMTQIEYELLQILKKKIKKNFKSIEFPANIRISHNIPPKDYLKKPFATDYIHQDSWSGEPSDSYIFFIYIHLYKNCSYMKMFKKTKKLKKYNRLLNSYGDIKINENELKQFKFPKKIGSNII